jgi:hypothetical protein
VIARLAWTLAIVATVVAGVCNGLGAPHGLAWATGAAVAAAVGLGASAAGAWFAKRER